MRQRVRLGSGRSEVRISGRSTLTECCQRFVTHGATFLRIELCCLQALQTRYTFPRNTANVMKY